MPSAFKRPGNRWFVRFKASDGRWVARRTPQQNRRDALKVAAALEAKAERQRLGLEAPEQTGELCGPLMRKWAAALTNRSRDTDLCRVDRHVLPHWRSVRVADVDPPSIMRWLKKMEKTKTIGPGSRRHCLGLLSRFMSWAVEEEHAQRNPCKDIPPGRRPRAIRPRPEEIPWIQTDDDVLRIMKALPAPFDAVFFIGNRSAARLSEILSLRLSDLDEIAQGVIRIRFAGDDGHGWLKEAKDGPKEKWAPMPAVDGRSVLEPILAQRLAAGAGPEDFLFVDADGDRIDRHAVAYRWREMRRELGLPAALNFYRGTRHSAVSRSLAAGASVDEVSAMCGHSAPSITLKHYNHYVRRHFSPILTAGLGLDGAPGAKVIPLTGRSPVTEAAAAPATETPEVAHG